MQRQLERSTGRTAQGQADCPLRRSQRTISSGKAGLKRGRPTGHSRSDPMLPVTVQFIVAMLAYSLNERMAQRLEYLQEQNRVLRDAFRAATGSATS
jgi:hypothetical protein